MELLFRSIFLLTMALPLHAQQVDSWDLPPVSYSDTPAADRVAGLAEKWASLPGGTPLERVRGILKELNVPEASQILVFSKTSKQNGLIHPGNMVDVKFMEPKGEDGDEGYEPDEYTWDHAVRGKHWRVRGYYRRY